MLYLRRRVVQRMFKGKSKVPYKISIKGPNYLIRLRLRWQYNFFKGFMEKMGEKIGKNLDIPNQFAANERSHYFLNKELKPTLDKIVEAEQKKIPGLKILSSKIQSANFVRDGEHINFNIIVEGICRV